MTSRLFIHPVTFVNTNDATSAIDPDASVTISGGLAVQKTAFFATKLYANGGIDVGNHIITHVSTPLTSTDAVNKSYVDGTILTTNFSIDNNANVLGISSNALGTGLIGGSGSVISLDSTQSFSNLTVTTSVDFSGIILSGAGTPLISTDVANKGYVDNVVNGITKSAGIGLTDVDNVFNVNTSQLQIDTLGTLTSLTVSGATDITSTLDSTSLQTGAFKVSGGASITKNLVVGGNFSTTGLVKLLSHSFTFSQGPIVVAFTVSNSAYYAKVTAILNETSTPTSTSVLIFETCGRTSTSTVWNIIENHTLDSYYFNPTVTVGGNGTSTQRCTFQPRVDSTYNLDVMIELKGDTSTIVSLILENNTYTL